MKVGEEVEGKEIRSRTFKLQNVVLVLAQDVSSSTIYVLTTRKIIFEMYTSLKMDFVL